MLAIYARKSVEVEDSKSIEEQIIRGKACAKDLGLEYRIYSETGVSGAADIDKRPEFSKMLNDIEEGLITHVYAFHQDRIERNPETRFIFSKIIRDNNVKLFYDNGEVDLDSDEFEMLGDMMSAMSKYFVRTTTKRIKNQVTRNISEGLAHGITAYGYMADDDKMLVLNPDEVEVVKLIFKLSLEGNGMIAIKNELNRLNIPTRYAKLADGRATSKEDYVVTNPHTGEQVIRSKKSVQWGASTIQGILYNRNYMGERIVKGITYKCPAIFTPEYFEKIQANLEANKMKGGKKTTHRYLLNGVLTCGSCGKRLTGRSTQNKGSNAYRCVDKRNGHQENRCRLRDIQSEPLDKLIWQRLFLDRRIVDSIKDYFSDLKVDNKIEQLEIERDKTYLELKETKGERMNLVRAISKEVITDEDAKDNMRELKGREAELAEILMKVKEQIDYKVKKKETAHDVETEFKLAKESAPFEQKQELIQKYVSMIHVNYDNGFYKIMIEYHLDIPNEEYVIDTKYNVAIEQKGNVIIPLSDKYKEKLNVGDRRAILWSNTYVFDSLVNKAIRKSLDFDHSNFFKGHLLYISRHTDFDKMIKGEDQ